MFLTVFDCFWPFLTAIDSFWLLLTAFDCGWMFLSVFAVYDIFWPFFTVFDNFWPFYRKYTLIDDGCWMREESTESTESIHWWMMDDKRKYRKSRSTESIHWLRMVESISSTEWYGDDYNGMAFWQFWLSPVWDDMLALWLFLEFCQQEFLQLSLSL